MVELSQYFWLTLALFIAKSLAVVIDENTITIDPVNLSIGDLTILPDVYYSIVNNAATSITGSLDNQGGFYVTSTDSSLTASVSLVSGSIHNSGELAFNSSRSLQSSSYNLNAVGDFINTGDMWFGISGFALAPINLGSTTNFENHGRIHFVQSDGNPSDVRINQAAGRVDNDGTVCVTNMHWIQTASIEGGGCINVRENARFQAQADPWEVLTNQTIYLSTPDSTFSVSGLSGSISGDKTFYIVGFGGGNVIRIGLGFDIQLLRGCLDSFF